jgi:carbamoyltransferase
MRILGLSSFKHDTAAALLEEGRITAAIENDKLARSRTRGLPDDAIGFCFNAASVGWDSLDLIAVATQPIKGSLRRSVLRAKLSMLAPLACAYCEANEIGNLSRDLNNLRILRRHTNGALHKVVSFEEHLCHAANSFFLSGFDRALIVTLDEDGDGNSGMLAVGEGTQIRTLRRIPCRNSLAWVYSQVTDLTGFLSHQEEHKLQWFGMAGEPVYKHVFLKMLRCGAKGPWPDLDYRFFNRGLVRHSAFSDKFYRECGLPSAPTKLQEDQRKALARSIQEACCEVIADLVEYYRHQEGIQQVCFAGGLFQNSLLVASLEKTLGPHQVFVPPAPGNAGTAVGAACLGWHQLVRKPRMEPVSSVYWGPRFNRQYIKDVLDNCKARYSPQNTEERSVEAAIQLLQAGKIVGWFQGATEFGPRALGNRSLLASPWALYVRENLNDYIKHREWFRPFAISVPEEDCARYFDASQQCRFMNSLARVCPEDLCVPESFLLPGNLVRLHVVEQRSNPLFWRLLKRFGEQAPAPMLLNTSFNLFGEPLVTTPRDAIRSYFCSGVDALIIGNFVLSKAAIPSPYVAQAQTGKLAGLSA